MARAQQRLPVRAAGARREGRGNDDEHHVTLRAEELRKAQVVADRQADATVRQHEPARLGAGRDRFRLVVILVAVREAEQVDLVVARDARAVRTVYEQ
jgi:hypothetical protein